MKKRLNIGWFSFSCCEDSSIIFTEMLNDHYKEWFHKLNFKHARILQTKNTLKNIDVAFVEGAINSRESIAILKRIRKNSKRLVAIGSCAIDGMPAAQRNYFNKKAREKIRFLLNRFDYTDKVYTLKEIVKVDYEVPGCPMEETKFLEILNKCFREFKIA